MVGDRYTCVFNQSGPQFVSTAVGIAPIQLRRHRRFGDECSIDTTLGAGEVSVIPREPFR